MAERLLREQSKALQQRLAKNDDKTRALGLRAWSGAVRTAVKFEGVFTPEDPAVASTVVSATVPAGRWLVYASATVGPVAAIVGAERIVFTCYAYDAASNAKLDAVAFDNPSSHVFFYDGISPPSVVSMTIVNDLKADEAVIVALTVVAVAGSDFTVTDPRLRLLPV